MADYINKIIFIFLFAILCGCKTSKDITSTQYQNHVDPIDFEPFTLNVNDIWIKPNERVRGAAKVLFMLSEKAEILDYSVFSLYLTDGITTKVYWINCNDYFNYNPQSIFKPDCYPDNVKHYMPLIDEKISNINFHYNKIYFQGGKRYKYKIKKKNFVKITFLFNGKDK